MDEKNKDPNELTQNSFYEDETLIERAGGNGQLLDRLVGLKIAEVKLLEDPDNQSIQRTYDIMKSEVERLENQ